MPVPIPLIPPTMSALTLLASGRAASTRHDQPAHSNVPGPGEVLLRVDACGFCHHDLLVMSGVLRRGVAAGVTLGHEIAGTVVGSGIPMWTSGLRPGDKVVSLLTAACGECQRCLAGNEHRCLNGAGIGHGRDGGFAEYVALPASALVRIPGRASRPNRPRCWPAPWVVAVNAVSAAEIAPGDTVVVTGAGGGLGSNSVQFAAAQGAQVIAVTTSPDKTADLESLGASLVALTSTTAPISRRS